MEKKLDINEYKALVQFFANGQYEIACGAAEAILRKAPAFGLAWKIMGASRQMLGRESVDALSNAHTLMPADAEVLSNLGKAFLDAGRLEEAVEACRKAIAIDATISEPWCNLGTVLHKLGALEEAVAALKQAIALDPANSTAAGSLGAMLYELGKSDAAAPLLENVLQHPNPKPEALLALAFIRLQEGRFKEGFALYEARWRCSEWSVKWNMTQTQWDGKTSLRGKRILLVSEQGFGDALQFARYIPFVVAAGAIVYVVTRSEIIPFIKQIDGVAEVYDFAEALPGYDAHCAFMSLPRAFSNDTDTLPSPAGYFQPDSTKARAWNERFRDKSILQVGFSWGGNPSYKDDKKRSMRVGDFEPLFGLKGIRFYSLQKDPAEQDRAFMDRFDNVTDLSNELPDFSERAAIMSALDVTITIDSSLAHLAGSTGSRVWVALPHVAEWRWMKDRSDSPWYGSARLFRQQSPGDWVNVIRQMALALTIGMRDGGFGRRRD